MANIAVCSLYVLMLVLPDFALPELLDESAGNGNKYEIKFVAKKSQRLKDGLKFVVEIENKTTESIKLTIIGRNPPFRYRISTEGFTDVNKSLNTDIHDYVYTQTIIIDGDSKFQFPPIVVKKYFIRDKKQKLKSGTLEILGSIDFIDFFEGKRKITTHIIESVVVDMKK